MRDLNELRFIVLPRTMAVRSLLKAGLFWAVLRGWLYGAGVIVPEPVVSALLLVVVLSLLLVDMTVLRERVFIENLGVGRLGVLRAAAAFVLLLDILASLAAVALTR